MMSRCTNGRRAARTARRAGAVEVLPWPRLASLILLLLSLVLSGIVPQGMMRAAGEDGVRLVLCTEEGPRDLWLSADGSVTGQAPLPESNQDRKSTRLNSSH